MGNKTSCDSSVSTASMGSEGSSSTSRKVRSGSTSSRNKVRQELNRPRNSPVPENPSEAMLSALRWVKAKNTKDMIKLYTVCSEDAMFHFVDCNMSLPMRAFWDAVMGVMQAFPDLTFSYSEVRETKPNVIEFINYVAEGHHTGLFEFAGHEDLAPTGAYVADEPIHLTIKVNPHDHKIVEMIADTNGGLAGPPGFYAKAKMACMIAKKQKQKHKQSKGDANAA